MKKYQLMAPGPTPVPSEVLLAMEEVGAHVEPIAVVTGVQVVQAIGQAAEGVVVAFKTGNLEDFRVSWIWINPPPPTVV